MDQAKVNMRVGGKGLKAKRSYFQQVLNLDALLEHHKQRIDLPKVSQNQLKGFLEFINESYLHPPPPALSAELVAEVESNALLFSFFECTLNVEEAFTKGYLEPAIGRHNVLRLTQTAFEVLGSPV